MLNSSILRFQVLLSLLSLAVLAAGAGFLITAANHDWQGLIVLVPAIGILAILLLPRMSRLDTGTFLLRTLICGFLLKLGFSMMRLWVGFEVYGGSVDASGYHRRGTIIAEQIWRLEFSDLLATLQWGTRFVDFFTGAIYSLTGPTLYGGYLVFALLGFLGSYSFYRAFDIAFPQGNKRLYAVLVFLSPSILYWPNGIGKDALIFLFIGFFAYGSAQLTRDRLQGLLPLILGLLGTACIRPHVAAILTIAFVMAFLIRGIGKKALRSGTLVTALLLMGAFAWLLLPRIVAYVGIQELSVEGAMDVLEFRQNQTAQGGSNFEAGDISRPLSFPIAMVTMLFRPLPWEANNLQAMAQSLESVMLIGVILLRIKSLGRAIASSLSSTYLRYLVICIIVFAVALSLIQNFGILARQRAMMLPFVFMLVAYGDSHADNAVSPRRLSLVE